MDEFGELLNFGIKAAVKRPNINGYRAHPTQEQFHASRAKGRVYIGGNRSGKTVAGATETVRALIGTDPFKKYPQPPLRARSVSVDRLQGINKIAFPEVVRWLPPSALINGSLEDSYTKTDSTLNLANGSFLEFLTYEQDLDKHAGTSRHLVWFDEEPDEAIFNENMMRLVDTNGLWFLTMTPVEGMTWVYDNVYNPVVNEGRDLGIDIITVSTDENPYITPQAIEALLINMTPEEREARRHGKFGETGGLVYKNFGPRNLTDPFLPPKNWMRINAMDHGLRNPTVWLFAAIDQKGNIYIYDEYTASNVLVPQHAEVVVKKELIYGEPLYRIGDPSIHNKNPITGTSVQIEYSDRGVDIIEGNNQMESGILRVQTYIGNETIEPKLFICTNCRGLISELRKYRWDTWASKKDELKKEKKEVPKKKDDHHVDALRYLIASRPENDTGQPVILTRNGLETVTALSPGERYASEFEGDTNETYSVLGSAEYW